MSADDDAAPPEADRTGGAPHPRRTVELFGQDAAEDALLSAFASGRMHHAWLLTGPRGVGKATLAWRVARFLAAQPAEAGLFGAEAPAGLHMDPDHPVFRRTAALGEGAIALCRRSWDGKRKVHRTQLTVDEIRRLKGQFALSAPDGGWRAAIIDAADEMNAAAANALLKLLEEPPARTVLLLVGHRPARLLPTIRSRCRRLALAPLSEEDLGRALAQGGYSLDDLALLHSLSGGAPGEAVRLIEGGGPALYPRILGLLAAAPRMDRQALRTLAAEAGGRANEARYDMILRLTQLALARLARAGAGHPGPLLQAEAPAAAVLAPGPHAARALAEAEADVAARAAHARAVNLDPAQVILDMFLAIETAVLRTAA